MGRKCCVPNCRGNYDSSEKVSVYGFPSDEERRRLWISKIPRDNFIPTHNSVVCQRHFCKEFIITIDSATRPDGSILSVERAHPKLAKDAYPSIFPLALTHPVKRKALLSKRKRKASDDCHEEKLDDHHEEKLDDHHEEKLDDHHEEKLDHHEEKFDDHHEEKLDDHHEEKLDNHHVENLDNHHEENLDNHHEENLDDHNEEKLDDHNEEKLDDHHEEKPDDHHDHQQEKRKKNDGSCNGRLQADKIDSFSHFNDTFRTKMDNNVWTYRLVNRNENTSQAPSSSALFQCWSFYRILNDFDANPRLVSTVKVFTDMHVEIFTDKLGRVPNTALNWIFGKSSGPPVLTSWSQFNTLLSHYSTVKGPDDNSLDEQLQYHVTALQDLREKIEDDELESTTFNLPKLQFLVEQMNLAGSSSSKTGKRYSTTTLLLAFELYTSAPETYSTLRDSLLCLPHPSYLRKLLK